MVLLGFEQMEKNNLELLWPYGNLLNKNIYNPLNKIYWTIGEGLQKKVSCISQLFP